VMYLVSLPKYVNRALFWGVGMGLGLVAVLDGLCDSEMSYLLLRSICAMILFSFCLAVLSRL
jgi:hypothetical protein